jgi:NADH pyrophosphatase NudC (nudix superfamily)
MYGKFIVNIEGAITHEGKYLLAVRGKGEEYQPGVLSLVGGKVEPDDLTDGVLEATLWREIKEEVGLAVGEMAYVESHTYAIDNDNPVVDVVFLCQYIGGEPSISDPDEVEAVYWMTADAIHNDPHIPVWTRNSIAKAEQVRLRLGW